MGPYPVFTPTISQPISTVIPFLDISFHTTSILPPIPPTSLVSPLPQLDLSLSTPFTPLSHPTIPFNLSPYSSSSLPIIDSFDASSPPSLTTDLLLSFLQVNLFHPPFIGILPGTTSEVFLSPQPLSFASPPPPFIFVFTPVILTPLNQAFSIPPLVTLPPLSSFPPLAPSPSSLPHPVSLTFTL